MAGTYHWPLDHIFNYVTIDDVNELMKYARPRLERAESERYTMLANIIKVTSFHEKGSDGSFKKLISELEFRDHDTGYLTRKFDPVALDMLKATREGYLAKQTQ